MHIYNSNFGLFKYADDMAMVGLMFKGNDELESSYINHINILLTWCKESALVWNKTKELVNTRGGKPITTEGQAVKLVGSYGRF